MMDTSNDSANAPSREELLGTLDTEIATLAAEQTSSGWSRWAILLGLGGLIWLEIDVWDKGALDKKLLVSLALIATVLWDFLRATVAALSNSRSSSLDGPPRFILISQFFGAFRPKLAFDALKALLILSAVAWIGSPLLILLAISAGFSLVGNLFGFVLTYLNWFPLVPSADHRPKKALCFASIAGAIDYISSFLNAVLMVVYGLSVEANMTPAVVRLALVFVAILYLISLLADEQIPTIRLQAIRRIRRNLAFRLVTMQEARNQADLLLVGGRLPQLLQRPFEELLSAISHTQKALTEIESRSTQPSLVADAAFEARTAVEKIDSKSLAMATAAPRAVTEYKDTERRLRFFVIQIRVALLFAPEAEFEVAPLIEKINLAMTPLRQRIKLLEPPTKI